MASIFQAQPSWGLLTLSLVSKVGSLELKSRSAKTKFQQFRKIHTAQYKRHWAYCWSSTIWTNGWMLTKLGANELPPHPLRPHETHRQRIAVHLRSQW